MLVLGDGDSLRGSASVTAVMDYSLHGLAGATISLLAEGQLASSDGELYPAAAIVVVKSMVLVNTHSAAVTINLTILKNGSTARRLVPKDLSLGIGYSLYFDGAKLYVINTSGEILNTFAVPAHATSHVTGGADVIANAIAAGSAGLMAGTDKDKLDNIEALADITDAANVGTAGAVMDSDISPAEGLIRKTGTGTYTAIKSNLNASSAPTVNDDTTEGYSVGSPWCDKAADKAYLCLDATEGAAVWIETTATGGDVATDEIWNAAGDLARGAGANAADILSGGSALALLKMNVGGTTFEWGAAGQIAFPATAVPSADANTLDDYEEGTWTMGVSFGGGTTGITYNAGYTTGSYVKIGRQVTLSGYCVMTSKGTDTGSALLTGLPFIIPNNNRDVPVAVIYFNKVSFANQHQHRGSKNTTTIALEEIAEGGVVTALTNANFADDSQFMFGFTYFI